MLGVLRAPPYGGESEDSGSTISRSIFCALKPHFGEHVAIIEDTFLTPRLTADLHIWWARGSLGEGNIPPVDWAAQVPVEGSCDDH